MNKKMNYRGKWNARTGCIWWKEDMDEIVDDWKEEEYQNESCLKVEEGG